MTLSLSACLAALLALSGCATQAQLRKVRNDERQMRGLLADNQVALDKLQRRVDVLETSRQGSRSEEGALSQKLQRRLSGLDARVVTLERAGGLSGAVPAGVPGALPQGIPGAETRPSGSERDVAIAREQSAIQGADVGTTYRDAFELVRTQQCDKAIPAFREFLYRNQKSDFADNAQFWIGSCYYDLKDYNRSILALNDVLSKYPQSEKIPGTLLLQAMAFAQLGDHVSKVDARLILQKLVSEYPNSEEAGRARQKLQTLGD